MIWEDVLKIGEEGKIATIKQLLLNQNKPITRENIMEEWTGAPPSAIGEKQIARTIQEAGMTEEELAHKYERFHGYERSEKNRQTSDKLMGYDEERLRRRENERLRRRELAEARQIIWDRNKERGKGFKSYKKRHSGDWDSDEWYRDYLPYHLRRKLEEKE